MILLVSRCLEDALDPVVAKGSFTFAGTLLGDDDLHNI